VCADLLARWFATEPGGELVLEFGVR
jgi:hypothetical protein